MKTTSTAKRRDLLAEAEIAALRKIAWASVPAPKRSEASSKGATSERRGPHLARPGDRAARAAVAELADVGKKQGSSRAHADRALAAVELAIARELARAPSGKARVRRPTPKAEAKLARIATTTLTALVRETARPERERARSTAVDPVMAKRFARVVDRQLKGTLGLSAPERERVVREATTAMCQAIEASLAESGVHLTTPHVRERHFVAALKGVLETSHAAASRFAHALRAKLGKSGPKDPEALTAGQRIADAVARFGGSWKFIISAVTTIAAWITLNGLTGLTWDPYPFILLNLVLSVLAALQGPVILMSQNRQNIRDRAELEETHDASLAVQDELRALRADQAEIGEMVKQLLAERGAATHEVAEGRGLSPS